MSIASSEPAGRLFHPTTKSRRSASVGRLKSTVSNSAPSLQPKLTAAVDTSEPAPEPTGAVPQSTPEIESHVSPSSQEATLQAAESIPKPAHDETDQSTKSAPLLSVISDATSDMLPSRHGSKVSAPVNLTGNDLQDPIHTFSPDTGLDNDLKTGSGPRKTKLNTALTSKRSRDKVSSKMGQFLKSLTRKVSRNGARSDESLRRTTGAPNRDVDGSTDQPPKQIGVLNKNPIPIEEGDLTAAGVATAMIDSKTPSFGVVRSVSDVEPPAQATARTKTVPVKGPEDKHLEADNFGSPVNIQKTIEIPLSLLKKVTSSPPILDALHKGNFADRTGIPIVNQLSSSPTTSTSPDDTSKPPEDYPDPPEEILDPSVHSPSAIVAPIPKISKIEPILQIAPPDLPQLAKGLGGMQVDDVGAIVNETGAILGYATGDLPSMVGQTVDEHGEIHDCSGDLIGYVAENHIDQPPQSDSPHGDVPEDLKIHHEGAILDGSGAVIGHSQNKPGAKSDVAPSVKSSRASSTKTGTQSRRTNAQTGGSPSDVFLDVKSTNDGIQLIIRIPTTFNKPASK